MIPLKKNLLDAAKNGEEAALAVVIGQMMPWLRQGAAGRVGPGLDFDDAVQEGLIALYGALQNFDDTRGARFETYAVACIQNAQASAQRAAGRKKHAPLNSSVPLTEDTPAPGPEEIAQQSEEYADLLVRIDATLSPMERAVLAHHLAGKSNPQTAAELAVSTKSVENALGRIRRKLSRG